MEHEVPHKVSIRLHSPELSGSEISEALQTKPSEVYERGVPLSLRNPQGKLREQTIWVYDIGAVPGTGFEDHVVAALLFLEGVHDRTSTLLLNSDIDVLCTYYAESGQASFALSADVMSRLANLPADLLVSFVSTDDILGAG